MKRRALLALPIGCCLILTGCISPSAVDDFAKASAQAASLFPAVATIPYRVCVANGQNLQLAAVTEFNPNFTFDQTKIDCKMADATSQRLQKTYTVLATYISTLDKLAGGTAPTYDANIKALAGNIPDLTSSQQTAVSGLASLIADLVDKGYRQNQAAKAIEKAQPWVQELSGMLKDQLPPFLNDYISNDADSLKSMYRGVAVFSLQGSTQHTSPTLVTKQFLEDKVQIQNMQNAVAAFEKIFASIAEGHTTLYTNRNKLWDKGVIQQLFQTAISIKKQVSAVETAFKPAAATTTK